jgi:hypothetical protein
MSSKPTDINALLGGASNDGLISQGTANILMNNRGLNSLLQQGLGVPAIQIALSMIYGQVVVLDDSSSIAQAGNEPVIREGVNGLRKELLSSTARDEILIAMNTINGRTICPFTNLKDCPELTPANYSASGQTPLYEGTVAGAGLLLTKWREFADAGAEFRGALVVVTDGAHYNPGGKLRPKDVKAALDDMRAQGPERFLALFIGIEDSHTDFKAVASEMGFADNAILTPKNTGSEIRKAFAVASRASKTASQSAGGFSKVAQGGFGAVTP